MSFIWKRPEGRLRTPEQVMAIIIGLVDGLNPPDKRGACVCAGMCVSAESDFWCPWNAAEPESKNYPFDSESDDGRSVGYCQQQTGPNGELWWGPVSQEMSAEGSIGEFLRRLIKAGYNASNAQTANDSVQAVQRSGVPQGYRGHWDRANALYDSVVGGAPPPPPPTPADYGLPTGTNITYGSPGFPDWVYQLASRFNVRASTYPGHQETDRNEAGYAPNPAHLNRAIDWAGSVADMQRFADYLSTIPQSLEQVIFQNPDTGRNTEIAGGRPQPGYFAADLAGHRDHVHTRQSKPIPMPGGAPVVVNPNRPDFNEYPMWSPNNSDRGGTKVDLFLLHTQEGDGNADSLAKYLQGHEVSYHYTISEDYNDHGVTVVDVVDTANASWSVLSANSRSINLCFAGSRVAWSRADWLQQSRAIDVAAYIAVQDCKKYGIAIKVLAPPYNSDPPGISDHKYVTQWLKDGTHVDVGNNFPWDVFAAAVNKYANPQPGTPNQGDDMALVSQEEWAQLRMQMDRVFHEVADLRESRSSVREPDEGPKDTWSGFGLNTDGSEHLEICKLLAGYGHPPTIALLKRVAAMPADKPGREGDCLIAQAILADVTSTPATPVVAAPVTPMAAPMAPVAPQVVYVDRPAPAPAPAPAALPAPVESNGAAPTTTGQAIGALFDALESMRLADALPIEARAPLSALISVLQTKNGSQL